MPIFAECDIESTVSSIVGELADPQKDLPRIARDPRLVAQIESAIRQMPSSHRLYRQDARKLDFLAADNVQLVLTSPPYWTLKEYRNSDGQLGHVDDYDEFLAQLDKVWAHCYRALVPGGRLIVV